LIRELRRERPDWLAAAQASVTRAELAFTAAGDDLVALQGVARVYLNGDLIRARNVSTLARELHEQGRSEKAKLLLDEVLRRTPGEERATRIRAELFPPEEIER
jgi:hypothetical protein